MKSAKVLVMLSLVSALAHGCRLPTAPLPDGAVPYAPNPQSIANWWEQVEECSGLRGDLSRINFYLVPDAPTFRWEGRDVIGLWMERDSRIVLAGDFAFREQNVRHEMLHALTRLPGHPREYFVDKCGAIVDQSQ
jgi:hypothetical protein